MRSGWLSFLCMAAITVVIFVNPNSAQSTDRLIVDDTTGVNNMFVAGDTAPIIRLNTNTVPSSYQSWWLIYGASNNSLAGLTLDSYGSAATYGGGEEFRFARGTQASPTAVQFGDRVGFFAFYGYDGTNSLGSAAMTAKVDGAVSTGNVPQKLVFETLATGYPRLERLVITSSGNVGIGGDTGSGITEPTHLLQLGGGAYSDGATWVNASSREYKENIKTLTREEADHVLDGLSPVKYNYKTDKEDQHVGFIAEDVPDLVATKDRKGLSPMDIVAVLTKVVQEQKDTIAELSKKVEAMQHEINRVKGMNIVGSIGESIK